MIGQTVDYSKLKDFIDYGLNKTLINLKIRRLADVKVREITQGKDIPQQKDWVKYLAIIFVVLALSLVLYQMIGQFINVGAKDTLISDLYVQLGQCKGQLAQYSPASAPVPANVSTQLVG